MPLEDLSLVTSTLINLLSARLSPAAVVAQAPDQVPTTSPDTVSVFLYHAREDAHYKNTVARDGTSAPLHTPLALCLYYVVTAHVHEDDKPVPLEEQRLMGYALKALHDYPVITESTKIGGADILHPSLRGGDNTLQIIYRPVGPEESATFWNGDDSRLIRFSAFYEVRVALMKPEAVTQLPGYVLSVGSHVLPTGVMHIASTHGVVRFTPPGGATIALAASPARVALEPSTPPSPEIPNNQLTLRGGRLGGGRLVLRSPLFTTPNNQIVVDPALNSAWDIKVTSTQITARVQAKVELPGGITRDVHPGTYGVSVQVSSEIPLPGGLTTTVTTRSNEHAVAFTPFVSEVGALSGGHVTIETPEMQTDLLADELVEEIEVFVAGVAFAKVADDPPGAGKFVVLDANHIKIGVLDSDPGVYPLRLIVRGAEAPPAWIEVDP